MLATSSSDAGVQAILRSDVGPLPNDWRISCRPSCPRPHQPTLPSSAPSEGAARVESRAGPACRLHARVRLRPHYHAVLEATGSRSATRAPPGSATLFRGDRRTHRRSHGPAAWSGGEVSARIAPAPRREPSYHVLLRRSPRTTHAHPRMLPVCASHTTGSGALAVSPLASPVPLEGGRALEPAVVEAYGVLDKPECSRVSLTTCASAAGPQASPRTGLRSTARSRRAVGRAEHRAPSGPSAACAG